MNKEIESMDDRPTWRIVLLGCTSLPFLIAARALWQSYPGFWLCLLFWIIALADEPLRWGEMRSRRRWLYGLTVVGGAMNAIATLSNGGHMPVLPVHALDLEAGSLWVLMTDAHRLKWLCDIHAGGSSLGDWFIGTGILGLIANWALEKLGALDPEPEVKGKRLPGLGIG